MYRIVIEKAAEKELSKIPPPHFNRVVKAIENLAENPRPAGYKKLTGRIGVRIRIGDYRIIYTVEDKALIIFIIDIGNRKDIYR